MTNIKIKTVRERMDLEIIAVFENNDSQNFSWSVGQFYIESNREIRQIVFEL